MELESRFDGSLGMKLGRKRNFEDHMFHHVAAERSRERNGLPAKEGILESPDRRGKGRGISVFSAKGHQGMPDASARCIAGGTALSRAGVGSVTVGSQSATVDPGV